MFKQVFHNYAANFLNISYDTAAIVDACNDWFANNEDYNKTVLYCHQAAKVLNWESEKQTLISLYNEAFAHR
jgi:glycosyltransferase involved in cell wall biosynthesis